MESFNFWDSNVWGFILLFAVLLASLLAGNILKKSIPFLQKSLIPTSVVGGAILLIVSWIYKAITGVVLFDTMAFGGNGTAILEIITYHTLALGFIASAFKSGNGSITKSRTSEIFNTGVTTVATYLLQATVGLTVTIIASLVIKGFFAGSGILVAFGFGQGTGQALNYGGIYESQYGFIGGRSFGLTVAAIGFLVASVGGVVHMNIVRRRGKLVLSKRTDGSASEKVETIGEIPMQESVDKLTVQIALIVVAYAVAYLLMFWLGKLLPNMRAVVYGFNFLLGVLVATIIKTIMSFLRTKHIIRKKYINNFLMTRTSNFFFDLMIVAGVAAIRLDSLGSYWGILIIVCALGTIATYIYNRIVAKSLFPEYAEEQFMAMYGMLTGTASTGIILLREIDKDFKTPVADNLVYQNFPAIVFGLPLMFLAILAATDALLTAIIIFVFFLVLNVILFRSKIFKRSRKKKKDE